MNNPFLPKDKRNVKTHIIALNHGRTDSMLMRVWHRRLAKGQAQFYAEHPNYPRLVNA